MGGAGRRADSLSVADSLRDAAGLGAGPTVLRMLVGSRLRALREAAGVTVPEAAEAIRASHSKISRLELGRTGYKQRDVADLLTLYGVHDEAERATLLELAHQASQPPWWHRFAEVVPDWFAPYLGLEQAAVLVRSYEMQFVPGVLQTEDYARAVIRLFHLDAPESEIDQRVELRMARRRMLERSTTQRLWTVVDEGALRRPHGGPAVMRAQLDHLIRVAEELPHVSVSVVPFHVGGHAAAGGPITLLRFPQDQLADVVYLEQLDSALYTNRQDDIEHYWHTLNRLALAAETPEASLATLRRIRDET